MLSDVKITIVVDNRIRIAQSQLTPELEAELKSLFKHENHQREYKRKLGFSVAKEPEHFATWERQGGALTFPRGGMTRIRDVLHKRGYSLTFEDRRVLGEKATPMSHNVALRDYQLAALDAALKTENCILRAPTGSGKTSIAMAMAAELSHRGIRTLVVVSTAALKTQWVTRAKRELGLLDSEIGSIGGGEYRLESLTVAMQQTLARRTDDPELLNHFGAIICDEVQLFAAPTFIKAIDPFPSRYRIGVSADHRRKDQKEFLIHDVFGQVAMAVSQQDLIAKGHVLDVEIRVIPTDFAAGWYGVPVDHKGRRTGRVLDVNKLYEEMRENPGREEQIMKVISDEVDEGNQVLVMSHRVEHCRQIDRQCIQRGIQSGLMLGCDENREQFDETRGGIVAGKIRVASGTYQAIGYGIDLPSAGVVVCATPLASNRQVFNQARGRACRPSPGKKARLYYIWDRHVVGMQHLKNLVDWNNVVRVWNGNGWIEAKDVLKSMRAA